MEGVPQTEDSTSELRRAAGISLHICASDHWMEQSALSEYTPEQFARDGFVHCTNDRQRLMEVANLYYRDDLRTYVALEIDLDAVPALALYEDDGNEFPHVYGPIPVTSVRKVLTIERGIDGTFRGLNESAGRS